MSETHRRVYHPTLNGFKDVPKDSADAWKKAGWRLTPHEGIDETDARPLGSYTPAQVPVLEDTTTATTTAGAGATATPAATTTATTGTSGTS